MDPPDTTDSVTASPPGDKPGDRPRRVLLVEDTIRGLGGSYESLFLTASGVDRARFEPVVLFFQQNHFAEKLEARGIRVLVQRSTRFWETEKYLKTTRTARDRLPRRGFFGAMRRSLVRFLRALIGGLPTTWTVYRLIRRERIDLLHANNNLRRDAMVILGGVLARVPVVVHERQITTYSGFVKWLSRRVRVLVCISDAVLQNAEERGARARHRVRVHNALDLAALRDVRRQLPPGPPRVGIIGRIMPKKGQAFFIEAAARIREIVPEALFFIIGQATGEDRGYEEEIRELSEQLGVASAIEWTGYLEEPMGLVASMDVTVHAGIEPEPFGRVIIESLALGVPVVATALGGPLEIIEDGVSGYLVPPGDAGAIAERVLALLQDPALKERMRGGALSRVEKRFSIETYNRRIAAVYRLALSRAGSEESAALASLSEMLDEGAGTGAEAQGSREGEEAS